MKKQNRIRLMLKSKMEFLWGQRSKYKKVYFWQQTFFLILFLLKINF